MKMKDEDGSPERRKDQRHRAAPRDGARTSRMEKDKGIGRSYKYERAGTL